MTAVAVAVVGLVAADLASAVDLADTAGWEDIAADLDT